MKRLYSTIMLTAMILVINLLSQSTHAQTKVTFNVNLNPMLEDSSFVPGVERLMVQGNFQPFTRTTHFELKDTPPKDGVYSVTITFPRRYTGETLDYNYFIQTFHRGTLKEDLPRLLELKGANILTPALYFNSYPY